MKPRLLDLPESEWAKEIERIVQRHPASPYNPRNRWTPKQIAALKALYGKVTLRVIAKEVGRPFPATKLRAWKLRLSHRPS